MIAKVLKKALLAFCAITALTPATIQAGDVDSENYPIYYLRGTFTNDGWQLHDTYKFTRDGNIYTLQLTTPISGELKISNSDWTSNYGSSETFDVYLTDKNAYRGVKNGSNWHADNLGNVTLKFEYKNEGDIKLLVGEQESGGAEGLSGTLPVIYINTDANLINKDFTDKTYFEGTYWVDPNGQEGVEALGSEDSPLALEIKLRGNYTRTGFSKKPYKLKLGKKQQMLGMSKSKHYTLLAHADDRRGFMRNYTGFQLGKLIGLPWTPSMQPVELVINGDYRGMYFLTEAIRIEEGRIEIEELADNETDASLASGGYLVELDNYDEDPSIQISFNQYGKYHGESTVRVTFDTPEVYSDIQRRFVTDQFTTINDFVCTTSTDLWKYMDQDMAARYYLVREILDDVESYHGSTYLFRDRGEGKKWTFSPLWDLGNAFNRDDNQRFLYDGSPFGNVWIEQMREMPTFNQKVYDTWKWFMSNKYNLLAPMLDSFAAKIDVAARADADRWEYAARPNHPQSTSVAVNRNVVKESLPKVKTLLASKIEFLKNQFGNYDVNNPSPEPTADNTPAASLPDYITTGIDIISFDADDFTSQYFTLTGIKVNALKKGEIYIVKRGSKVSKEIVK